MHRNSITPIYQGITFEVFTNSSKVITFVVNIDGLSGEEKTLELPSARLSITDPTLVTCRYKDRQNMMKNLELDNIQYLTIPELCRRILDKKYNLTVEWYYG